MANETNYQELAKKLSVLAEKGDAKSQYHLGVLYNDGKGVEKDYAQAASWYLKAAQQGHPKAQLYLGLLYQNGHGVQRDYKKAALCFTKSAEQGEQKAQYYLGALYNKGLGVVKNTELAVSWLEKSAQQGNINAQKLLDEILSVPDIDNEIDDLIPNLDIVDSKQTFELNQNEKIEEENYYHQNNYAKVNHSSNNMGVLILVGIIVFSVVAGGIGAGYFYLKSAKISTNNANSTSITRTIDTNSQSEENFDVFKLAETGTPKQLKNAMKNGVNFNVERNLNDDDEHSLFDYGETPLHRAAYYNKNADSISFLISQGLNVNAEASSGNVFLGTPLSCAVTSGNIDAAVELLKAGANPNSYSSDGNMFQIVALDDKDFSVSKNIVKALIKFGGKVDEHNETDKKRNIILPRTSWTSQNFSENILDDVTDDDIVSFIFSSPALTCAVLNDNPELVDLFIELGANPNLSNIEGRIAMDYADELPENSKIRRSETFKRLQTATNTSIKKFITSAKDDQSAKYLNSLLAKNKVPDYIRNEGQFFCNQEAINIGGVVEIKGHNVRMRSLPNTDSQIITQLDEDNPANFPTYAGEWTNSKGERWVLAEYFDNNTNDTETAWIFGKYTDLISGEEYAVLLDNIVESEEYENNNDDLIAFIKNNMYYNSYPKEAGYLPVGQQFERFFSDYKWQFEKINDEEYGNKRVVFSGIGVGKNNRRLFFQVFFVKKVSSGEIILDKINVNHERVYSYSTEMLTNRGFGNILQGMSFLATGLNTGIPDQHKFDNQFSLNDFLEYIYQF